MMLPDPDRQSEFYASVAPKRALAWLIDGVLIALICAIILPFTAFTGLFFLPLLFVVVGFIYRVLTLAGGSATWGMRLMAIELRNHDGERLDLSLAFWHTLGYSISISSGILQLVSIVLMLASARGQSLTDHILGTVMLNKRAR